MPVRLRHIVVDAHDLHGLARFWTQALGWKLLSERGNEIVIGTDENAPAGMCFMPVTDLWVPKTCATWPDGLLAAGCSATCLAHASQAGLGLPGRGMIFGLWA